VLLLSNARICTDRIEPVVLVAPLSHLTELKTACDLFIKADDLNRLACNSRLILGHAQPVLKSDLLGKVGSFSSGDFDRVKAHMIWMLGLDDEE